MEEMPEDMARAFSAPSAPVTPLEPHFINKGNAFGNRVALTYDDGPSPGVTEKVLEELAKRNLRATFFMIGKKAKAYASLAKEVADAGHEVANHTFTHPNLAKLSQSRVEDEIERAQQAIAEATGQEPQWFRPPYGAFHRKRQGPIPLENGLGVAYWSVDPRDWSRPGRQQIIDRVVGQSFPGSIILLHDLHFQTASATGELLDGLQEKAYSLSTLTSFVGLPYA